MSGAPEQDLLAQGSAAAKQLGLYVIIDTILKVIRKVDGRITVDDFNEAIQLFRLEMTPKEKELLLNLFGLQSNS